MRLSGQRCQVAPTHAERALVPDDLSATLWAVLLLPRLARLTDAEKSTYAEAVWEELTRRTGQPERIMSCLEWETLRGWLLAEIPLRVVLRGMADAKKRALRLEYYEGPVRAAYGQWRKAVQA